MNTSKVKQKEKNVTLKFQQQRQEQEPEIVIEPSEEDKESKDERGNRGIKFARNASRFFKQSIFGTKRNEILPDNGLDYFK